MRVRMFVALALSGFGVLGAQEPALTVADAAREERMPRFLFATGTRPVPVDAARTPVLRQRISVDFRGVALGEALEVIARESGLKLMYSWSTVPVDRLVTLKAENITVSGALIEVLFDAGVDVLFERDGQAAIVKRPAPPAVGTITGRVTEAATGNAVAQAQVSVSGHSRGATTGEDGRYSIVGVAAGMKTVTVRRLGYDPQSREVSVTDGGSATADFALAGATTRLAEVVTTATGAQRRVELGNSIAAINADSLAAMTPSASFGDLLQGRSAGVMSLQEGGQSGKAGRIRIRGVSSSFLSNDPIVVMDGIRIEAGSGSHTLFGAAQVAAGVNGFSGRLADLNPEEIASIEIVKGPSASTLYGTDAANGVIVITTKRGTPGKTRWTVSTEQGVLQEKFDTDDAFRPAYFAYGRNNTTGAQQRCTLLQQAASVCTLDSLRSFNVYTDPRTTPFKDSPRRQYGTQVSGGMASGATYFVSADYDHEVGTFNLPRADRELLAATRDLTEIPDWMQRPNAQRRVNVRANATMPFSGRGSATLSTSFVSNQSRQLVNTGDNLTFTSGNRHVNDGWNVGATPRPVYSFTRRGEDAAQRFVASLGGTYAAADWLSVRATVGADLSADHFDWTIRREDDNPSFALNGQRSTTDLSVARYSADAGATATRAVSPSLQSRTSVGLQYNRRGQRGSGVSVTNLPLGGVTITGATISSGQEATIASAVAGAYVDQFFGWRDRVFVTGAVRFDGGSAFGEDFDVAAYPKVSVSYLVTDGSTGLRIPGLTSLRLRSAYGASGVQPGPTDAFSRATAQNSLNFAGTAAGPGAFFTPGNPNLKPERSTEAEAGLDAEAWSSRVRLELTAYEKTTSDALFSVTNAPSAGGGASSLVNLGKVRNRGIEAMLSVEALRTTQLTTGVSFNGALSDNKVLRLGDGVLATNPTTQGNRLQEGYPLFGLWGRGVVSFADANGNSIIEGTEIVLGPTTSAFVGPTVPTREATVSPYVRLLGERIHLSGLVQYRGGYYRRATPCSALQGVRAENDPSTPLADQVCFVAGTTLSTQGPGQLDASYLTLRELSASVRVPGALLTRLRAHEGTLLFAARNVAPLWKASSAPIDAALTSTDGAQGNIVARGYPTPPRLLMARVTLSF